MDDHAEDVTWTGEHSVGPDSVFKGQALLLERALVARIIAQELVNLIVGWVGKHVITIVVVEVLIFLTLSLRDRFPKFPVCLTIELISLDKDRATGFSSFEQNKICRDALSLIHLHNHTDFYVF